MSEYQNPVNEQEIAELVRLLRQNGDKVLSASSKLSLSTVLLYNLNVAFSSIVDGPEDLESSFQVCNSSKIDIFQDLKFLHDFVQKTIGLKIIFCPNKPEITVDITKFRHLKYLELKKVCIDHVKGLQSIRGQLESISCSGKKGVSSISQLLVSCGADAGIGFIWASLKHLSLPHNALTQLDKSLELAPWLQMIDISHNLITKADELACLPNLKYINLGYNKLESIPTFNKSASHTLQVLVLKNNYIENLNGLEALECLTELDLSYNYLTEHSTLWPLERMSILLWLSLEGNPMSYHPKHRNSTIRYLHPCLGDSKFALDHVPLTRSEKQIVAENRFSNIKSNKSTSRELLASFSTSVNSSYCASSITASINSVQSVSQSSSVSCTEKSLQKARKKQNVKEAIIGEEEHDRQELQTESSTPSPYLETSKEHLEIKKQILALREKYGEHHWLSSNAGTFVQDIMGLPPSTYSPLTTIEAIESITPLSNSVGPDVVYSKSEPTGNLEYSTKDTKSHKEDEEGVDVLSNEENEQSSPVMETVIAVAEVSEPPYDPDEEMGDLYLVQTKKENNELEELFLVITDDDIKERDTVTGKVKCCWSTESVLSCVLGRSEPVTVDIIFDTARKDRENRRYFAEAQDAKKIVKLIGEKMKKRPLALKVFKCMKCSTQFSQDSEYSTVLTTSLSDVKQLKCPTCGSTLVIQTDELSTVENDDTEDLRPENNPDKAENLESSTETNLHHSESYSSIGSATSLEDSRESTPSTNAINKKYDSDIEVLSNPSQSSIEVLDDASKTNLTPQRKQSSEERHITLAPSALPIPDTIPIMTGLTESSSSGSLTDSICTTYENKTGKRNNTEEKSELSDNDKDMKYAPVTNLTSVLGGLLQSIKIGGNKPLLLKTDEAAPYLGNNIQYSYTDFSSVDHRIKLHIILNVFEHKNEELILLLRAHILTHSAKNGFPGCLVLSTLKLYVLRIDGPEGEDPQRWLYKESSWTMDRLRSFAPLPFKQGVLVELQQPNKMNEGHSTVTFLCILQDFQRTSNFLFYLTDLSLPPSCEVEFSIPEQCTNSIHNVLKKSKNYQEGDAVRLLSLFSNATLKYEDHDVHLKLSSLIVTASVLVVFEDNIHWLLPSSEEVPAIIREQAMSNLISVEHCGMTLTLKFLDEVAGLEDIWKLTFISTNAAEAVINSVQPPWEELFSIPLQITTKSPQHGKSV